MVATPPPGSPRLIRPFAPNVPPLLRCPKYRGLSEELRIFLDQVSRAHDAIHSPWRLDLLYFGRRFALVRIPVDRMHGDAEAPVLIQLVVSAPARQPVRIWKESRLELHAEETAVSEVMGADLEWVRLAEIGAHLKDRGAELSHQADEQLAVLERAAAARGGHRVLVQPLTWSLSAEDLEVATATAILQLGELRMRLSCEVSARSPDVVWRADALYVALEEAQRQDPLALIRSTQRPG